MNSANGRIEMPNNLNKFEESHDAGQTENRTRSTSARTDANTMRDSNPLYFLAGRPGSNVSHANS